MNLLLKLQGFSPAGRIEKHQSRSWVGWGMALLPRGVGHQIQKELLSLLLTLKTTTGVEALRPIEL